jgi:general secretion pathway protein E
MRSLDEAGYAPSQLRLWRLAGRSCAGLILTGGVTGSGKSTTAQLFLETLPGLDRKAVYTVEDPIEYPIQGVHQIEVLRDLGSEEETRRRYARVLQALLRGDPDGVFIGEIRDRMTAGFALQIAATGHLSMSTLHVRMISNMIPRLTNSDMGLSRGALTNPDIINLLVFQSLVPLVCPACALTPPAAAEADPEVAELLEILRDKFRVPTHRMRFKNPAGCPACRHRGTAGRTVVAEMWQPDRRWLQMVRAGDDYEALLHYRSLSDRDFCSGDMTGKSVFEHALYKAIAGLVDPRQCNDFQTFERFEILEATA